jgi:hypothetical protein
MLIGFVHSHFVHQARQRKKNIQLGLLIPAKRTQMAKKMQLSQNNLSTSPNRLAVVAIRSATRTGTVPAGWQLLSLFV